MISKTIMDDLIISKREAEQLLTSAFQVGFQRGLETLGERPKYISQNRAFRMFKRSRVKNWVANGLIQPLPNGCGKTSTIQFELAKLMTLDASNRIVIRKAYVSTKKQQS
jgi:hypothetical protein